MTLSALAAPAAYAIALWWLSTVVIVYLDGLPRRTYPRSLAIATVVLVLALAGLWLSARHAGPVPAYVSFTCALAVWGWVEMSFLMGLVTGPRRSACPPLAKGWQRWRCALEAIWHHELLLLACAAAIFALTAGAPNALGWWTFVLLWVARVSAKLNVFLGVRNLGETLLPEHLRYLVSYFARRAMNPLFPGALLAGLLAAGLLWREAANATAGESVAWTLLATLATLATLAIVEHVLLMIPIRTDRIWQWASGERRS